MRLVRTILFVSAVAGAGALTVAACLRSTAFHCANDQGCGPGGSCEPDGFCSVLDPGCPSGSRYSDTAGANAGQCVGGGGGSDGGGRDENSDLNCFGTGFEHVCLGASPEPALTIDAPINTDTDRKCLAAYPDVCAFGAVDVVVRDSVVTGSRPLVVVAANTLMVTGTLDASSTAGGQAGAGSNNAACTLALGTSGIDGAGGGAGGSFGGRGGDGGSGDLDMADNSGGSAAATTAQNKLVGGCPGSAGGDAGASVGAVGGRSGGALYLIAGVRIEVSGDVFASGAGGGGASAEAGGGGGGSGGMIGLDAPTVAVSGRVVANGAGGGGGGGSGGGAGTGGDGTTTQATSPATGGSGGGGGGGLGGAGTSGADRTGKPGKDSATRGGGGGGGGAGIIRIFPPQSPGGTVSPDPS